jgi:hypothetical protein
VSILAAAFVLGFIVIVFIHNQSVLVWRTFHADLTLLRPHITNEKDRELCAHFSAMTKRNDYLIIKKDMEDIANRNNVRLHDIKLW